MHGATAVVLLGLLATGAAFRAPLRMALQQQAMQGEVTGTGIPGVRSIIACSSAKGGVGKSTTAVNLAYALNEQGYKVGILDADVFGPSLPTMVSPESKVVELVGSSFVPLEANGVKLMSLGYIREGVSIMRGPMVMQLMGQLLENTAWGELDYLVIDMPPGTGDVQLTLVQALNITAAVIVTTPQRLSFVDVVKGIDMFDTVGVPCVAVVENMAYYNVADLQQMETDLKSQLRQRLDSATSLEGVADDLDDLVSETLTKHPKYQRRRVFGQGHRQRLADMWGIQNTVSLPIVDEIAETGDSGTPYMIQHPESQHAGAFRELAHGVAADVEEMLRAGSGLPELEVDLEGREMNVGPRKLDFVELRAKCRCALCVEELSGKPLLDPATIPEDITPANIGRVGRYAFSVDWSDGHKSLYPYRWILEGK